MPKENENEQELHKDYKKYLPYWQQIRVFVEGLRDIQDYLQGVSVNTDQSSILRNRDYKARAKYTNFPARTRNALVGAVFSREAQVIIPDKIAYLQDSVDGTNNSLEHLAKRAITNVIEVGRHGLFVDYGTVRGINRAKILSYTAENIVYWECDESGQLEEVVLKLKDNKYKHLCLENGVYTIEIYDQEGKMVGEPIIPTDFHKKSFDYIPFIFIGSTDNNPDVDDMPLWSIVDVTHGHYQNSADYEDILRFLIPTPAVTAPNQQWVKEMLPNGIYTFGDGSIIPLPERGTASLLQAAPNQMHSEAMKQKEEQLLMLGARLVASGGQAETAEAVKIKFSAENGVLDNLVGNTSDAIEQCLVWCAAFEGLVLNEEDIEYDLNRQFWDTKLSPQEITALFLGLDRQAYGLSTVRDNLRAGGIIEADKTDEELDQEVGLAGGGLNTAGMGED